MTLSCINKSDKIVDNSFSYQKELFKKTLDSTTLVISTVATNLKIPWEITFGSNDSILWFTEIEGKVNRLNLITGNITNVLKIPNILVKKSYGLLGFALTPDFKNNPYAVLHYTYIKNGSILSRLIRYTYDKNKLIDPKILIDSIPGQTYHNGSRIVISQEQIIYLSTGDAGVKSNSQNVNSLSGKILRVNMDGSIPADNPFKGSPIFTWGLRNTQGLDFGNGMLYCSDHGSANDDEINIIKPLSNYGWPDVTGLCNTSEELNYCKDSVITEPIKSWTPTIAPAGIAYYASDKIPEWNNSLLVATLKDASLRVLKLSEDGLSVEKEIIALNRQFGRIRDLAVAPNGDIYLCTSNQDWHPNAFPENYDDIKIPTHDDDRIIRIFRANITLKDNLSEMKERESPSLALTVKGKKQIRGRNIYELYCSVCHRVDGTGADDLAPPLSKSDWIYEKDKLIDATINGLSGEITVGDKVYNQEMPSFKFLKDEELSDVLSYIRRSFGNKRSSISVEEIRNAK